MPEGNHSRTSRIHQQERAGESFTRTASEEVGNGDHFLCRLNDRGEQTYAVPRSGTKIGSLTSRTNWPATRSSLIFSMKISTIRAKRRPSDSSFFMSAWGWALLDGMPLSRSICARRWRPSRSAFPARWNRTRAARICPEAYQYLDTRNLIEKPTIKIGAIALIFLALCLVVLAVNFYLFKTGSVGLAQSLHEILRHDLGR